jgi:hypothetical protein
MKKLLIFISGLWTVGVAFRDPSMLTLKVDAKIKFETVHVSEGRRTMDQNFTHSIVVDFSVFGSGELYMRLDVYLKATNKKAERNEVAPSIGFSYDIMDIFTVAMAIPTVTLDVLTLENFLKMQIQ